MFRHSLPDTPVRTRAASPASGSGFLPLLLRQDQRALPELRQVVQGQRLLADRLARPPGSSRRETPTAGQRTAAAPARAAGSSTRSPPGGSGAAPAVPRRLTRNSKRCASWREHLRRRQHLRPRRRQLDRQRDAFQAVAQLRHGGRVLLGHLEVGLDRLRPVDEELHALRTAQLLRRARSPRVSEGSGRRNSRSPASSSRCRDVTRHSRTARAPAASARPARPPPQLLEVVQHQQRRLPGERSTPAPAAPCAERGQAQRVRAASAIRRGSDRSASGTNQTAPPNRSSRRLRLQRQARLARAAGTGQGHQPLVGQQRRASPALSRPKKRVNCRGKVRPNSPSARGGEKRACGMPGYSTWNSRSGVWTSRSR